MVFLVICASHNRPCCLRCSYSLIKTWCSLSQSVFVSIVVVVFVVIIDDTVKAMVLLSCLICVIIVGVVCRVAIDNRAQLWSVFIV